MKNNLKIKCVLICSILAIAMAILPPSSIAEGKTYELSFAGPYYGQHPTLVNAWRPWIEKVAKMSNGALKFEYFEPNALAPYRDQFDSTVAGTIDLGAQFCGIAPGKFPMAELMDLPFLVPNAETASKVTWELYQKFPEWRDQFKGVKGMWMWTSALFELNTVKKPVHTLEDLKGLKIICWSPKMIQMMKLLGASPLEIRPHDSYLALQRGMADGILIPLAPIRSFKISEVAKYHTMVDIAVGPFWAGFNQNAWNKLTPELQKILTNTTGAEMARSSGKTLDDGQAMDYKWLKENGHTMIELSMAEKERWKTKLQTLHDDWLKSMEAKGYKNAKAMYDYAVSAVANK